VGAFDELGRIAPLPIWNGIVARIVSGERLTLAVVELDPDAVAAEHAHENEQLGIVLEGSMSFRVGDEKRELGPGETWTIPSGTPHDRRLRSAARRLERARAASASSAALALATRLRRQRARHERPAEKEPAELVRLAAGAEAGGGREER